MCFVSSSRPLPCPSSGPKRSHAPGFLCFVVDLPPGSQHVASLQSGRVLGFEGIPAPGERASDHMSGELAWRPVADHCLMMGEDMENGFLLSREGGQEGSSKLACSPGFWCLVGV